MAIVGGLRTRLIYDSIYNMLNTSLTSLGWFAAGRQHLPINFITTPVDDKEPVPLNTLVLLGEDQFGFYDEMGSDWSEHRRNFFLDFYAESNALGEHLIFDCKDILEGRMPSISRTDPIVVCYDYTQVADPEFARVEIENVDVDRAHNIQYAWQKHWYSCAFTVVDYYGNENDN